MKNGLTTNPGSEQKQNYSATKWTKLKLLLLLLLLIYALTGHDVAVSVPTPIFRPTRVV